MIIPFFSNNGCNGFSAMRSIDDFFSLSIYRLQELWFLTVVSFFMECVYKIRVLNAMTFL